MTHQTRFSRNKEIKADELIDECNKARKPLLHSSDDVERMAVERARAKLIRQLVSKPPETSREFNSNYCGHSQIIDPVYSATSHTVNDRELTHASVIPAYPTLVNSVRWKPATTKATSMYNCQNNERQNIRESSNFTCRCIKCGGQHCKGQSGAEYKPRIFRDNIKRFADSMTMTSKLTDACCGSCTPVLTSRKTSDVSVSSSDVVVREKHCPKAGISQVYINCDPVSILKNKKCDSAVYYKREDDDAYCAQTEKTCRIADDYQEAVRDTEEKIYDERNNSKPMRSFPKVVRNKLQNDKVENEPRKNVYNEGISDLTINLLPAALVYPERPQATKNLTPSNSSFLNKRTQRRNEVPFAHNTESRYHYTCKTPEIKSYYGSNNNIDRETYMKKFKKTYASKPVPYYNTESAKFPRRVLTSERDIDSYVGSEFMKVPNR